MAFPTRADVMGMPPIGSGGFMGVPPPPVQVAPVLDSRARGGVLGPKYGLKQGLTDVLVPALAGLAAGPAGALAGAMFGINNAAGRYRLAKDPLAQAQYAAQLAQAQVVPQVVPSQARADIAVNEFTAANPGAAFAARTNVPAQLQIAAQVDAMGLTRGTPEWNEAYQRIAAPSTLAPQFFQNGPDVMRVDPVTNRVSVVPGVPGKTSSQVAQGRGQIAYSEGIGGAQGRIDAETNPANVQRVADAEAITTAAGEQAKFNEAQYGATVSALGDMRKTRSLLQRIRDAVERGPETGPVEQYRALVDADLQELRSYIEANTLASYAAARGQGVTFGSTTESEWKKIASLGASLANSKQANLRILDAALDQVDEQVGETAGKLRRIPEGRGRMPAPGVPGGPPNTQRPPLAQFERPY